MRAEQVRQMFLCLRLIKKIGDRFWHLSRAFVLGWDCYYIKMVNGSYVSSVAGVAAWGLHAGLTWMMVWGHSATKWFVSLLLLHRLPSAGQVVPANKACSVSSNPCIQSMDLWRCGSPGPDLGTYLTSLTGLSSFLLDVMSFNCLLAD